MLYGDHRCVWDRPWCSDVQDHLDRRCNQLRCATIQLLVQTRAITTMVERFLVCCRDTSCNKMFLLLSSFCLPRKFLPFELIRFTVRIFHDVTCSLPLATYRKWRAREIALPPCKQFVWLGTWYGKYRFDCSGTRNFSHSVLGNIYVGYRSILWYPGSIALNCRQHHMALKRVGLARTGLPLSWNSPC